MVKAVGIGTALLHFFQENPNRAVTIDELMKAFPQWDRHQLLSAVSNTRKTNVGSVIEVLGTGVWKLPNENTESDKMTFSVLKATDSQLVLEDANGDIWRAEFVG